MKGTQVELNPYERKVLDLYGGDPFGNIVRAAEEHRPLHGEDCGLYPAGPHVMRVVATLVEATAARRILDIGAGFGYSALWMAGAAGEDARIDSIERWGEHIEAAIGFVSAAGYSKHIRFHHGGAVDVLPRLDGPYDFIHDDGWFAEEPPYFRRMLELLRPGGTLTMPNWFLLEDATTGKLRRDWSDFAGHGWAEWTQHYAERLAAEPSLRVTWLASPPLGIAVKRAASGL